MPWTTVILSMAAAMSLTLAAIHARVWLHERESRESLLFTVAALSAVAVGLLEAWLMHSPSPAAYGERLRWLHLPTGLVAIALAWFIPVYLRAGRTWFAWLITAGRVLLLAVNFSAPVNATFSEITGLRTVVFLGEPLSVPIGVPSPWHLLARLTGILLILHALDAGLAARRLRTRQRPLLLAGVIAYAAIQSAVFSNLVVRGVLPGPLIGIAFALIVVVMAYELSSDLMRSVQTASDLKRSRSRLELAAQAADLVLWEWDARRDEIWVAGDDRMAAALPTTEPMTLERFLESVHPDDRGATREAVIRAMEGEQDLRAEYRQATEDGTTSWFSVSGTVETDARGRAVLVRGASRNITLRKQAQTELELRRQELAHVQRASTVDQLSSALVHELSQPLGAILRNAEAAELLIRKDPIDLEEIRDIVHDVQQDDRRAMLIIDRMRSLLKRRELVFEAIPIETLVGEVAGLLQTEFQARDVTLRMSIEPGLPDAHGDRVHLQQVIINLLFNALDAVEGQSPERRTIEIRVCRRAAGGLEFAVSDRGSGIPADQLSRVFEEFFTSKADGTGLGLSISRTIVESHGGRIWAESNPDGGATFRFTVEQAPTGREP